MAPDPLQLWNKWGIQILVLLSLALQITLLLTAGIRRREAPPVLRLVLWLAYTLADPTAIYALGNLSFGSVATDHPLAAFWAPFLLLHLGGPDNITAYSLQDNELWRRHLLNLVIQILGAGYILYKFTIVGGKTTTNLLVATVLMFAVGLAKYCERTVALYCGDLGSIARSVKELPSKHLRSYQAYLQLDDYRKGDDEFLLQRAHSLFHICKRGIVDSAVDADAEEGEPAETIKQMIRYIKHADSLDKVMEMELSLMYDILYTKAAVIHTWFGYCVRISSPVVITVSFLLFQFSGSKHGQNGVDVTVTYVLLGGALVMETTSLLNAISSSWVLAFLCTRRWSRLRHAALCNRSWHRLRQAVLNLRRFVRERTCGLLGISRRRTGTIDQFNLLYCRSSKIHMMDHTFRWLANKLGFEDWWDRTGYSWTIMIPEKVQDRAVEMVSNSKDDINTMGFLRPKWGEMAFRNYSELWERLKDWNGVDFQESIIVWHIATDLVLSRRTNKSSGDLVDAQNKVVERVGLLGSIRAISNYLMFLLVTHPEMLPGLPQNWLYQLTCKNLDNTCEKHSGQLISSGGKANNKALISRVLLKLLQGHYNRTTHFWLKQTDVVARILLEDEQYGTFVTSVPRLTYARKIAMELLKWEDENKSKKADPDTVLLLLVDLWTDYLIYAANRCNRKSHAKKLNSGGEFITVIWLMVEHIYQTKEKTKAQATG